MRAGALRHRIDLQQPTGSQDGSGDEVFSYATALTVWADIAPLKGRELIAADQQKFEADTRIVVRWSPEVDVVDPQWRIQFGVRLYNIQAVIHVDMARDEVQFMCNSGVKEQ